MPQFRWNCHYYCYYLQWKLIYVLRRKWNCFMCLNLISELQFVCLLQHGRTLCGCCSNNVACTALLCPESNTVIIKLEIFNFVFYPWNFQQVRISLWYRNLCSEPAWCLSHLYTLLQWSRTVFRNSLHHIQCCFVMFNIPSLLGFLYISWSPATPRITVI
jgi:hypothetical protein